jgi:uncharacterized protein (TIGR00255 family)
MTGLGSATHTREGVALRVEVRSVNHRWLKLSLKLPRELASMEAAVEARTQLVLRRGAVSINVVSTRTNPGASALLDRAAMSAWHQELTATAAALGLDPKGVSLESLLALPGVVGSSEAAQALNLPDATQDFVLRCVDEALQDLQRARAQEGQAMVDVLRRELDGALVHHAAIAQRAQAFPASARERLLMRLQEMVKGLPEGARPDERELAREVLFAADRADVTEELDRFTEHAKRVRTLLNDGGEVGRKLDFLLQEMLREANTIGSKSQDATLTHEVVELKCRIERMKEQVQNLE